MAFVVKSISPRVLMAFTFLGVQIVALLIVPIYPREYRIFGDPGDIKNSLFYVLIIIVVTALMLLLLKLRMEVVLKAVFAYAVFVTISFVVFPLAFMVIEDMLISLALSMIFAGFMIALLFIHSEWYVMNTVAFLMGCGVAALLGMSLGVIPALVLLVILALYDAIAVYVTKHMVPLAEGIVSMGIPVVFIIPKRKGFSIGSMNLDKIPKGTSIREVVIMGLGDAIIPGILVVSSFVSLSGVPGSVYSANLLVSVGTLIGSFCGLLMLFFSAKKGKPHAALPFINGGAIAGFLITYLLIFGNFTF
ncbi:MAG: presenilin family intramembrane aspartyl protease PSH [Methanomassiliicoccales archaeon]